MRYLLWLVYIQPLGMIWLWIGCLLVLWCVLGICFRNRRAWSVMNYVGFAVITVTILYSTIYNRSGSTADVVLVPFYSFIEAQKQPEKYREMLMNVFLFVPFGLTAPNVLSRLKRFYPAVFAILLACIFSAAIEFSQYYFQLGRCEVDDVLWNSLGTAIGTSSYIMAQWPNRA